MEHYEIKVLPENGAGPTTVEIMYAGDSAAIRGALKLAKKMPFEVWRSSNCIYGSSTSTYTPQYRNLRKQN